MFNRPPPESALHRLMHNELCIITLGDREIEATWSANTYVFWFKDDGGVHEFCHTEVDGWRPAGIKY
jgi:hypothetical protein